MIILCISDWTWIDFGWESTILIKLTVSNFFQGYSWRSQDTSFSHALFTCPPHIYPSIRPSLALHCIFYASFHFLLNDLLIPRIKFFLTLFKSKTAVLVQLCSSRQSSVVVYLVYYLTTLLTSVKFAYVILISVYGWVRMLISSPFKCWEGTFVHQLILLLLYRVIINNNRRIQAIIIVLLIKCIRISILDHDCIFLVLYISNFLYFVFSNVYFCIS